MTTIDFVFDSLRDDIYGEVQCLYEEREELLRIVVDWQIHLKPCLAIVLGSLHRHQKNCINKMFLQKFSRHTVQGNDVQCIETRVVDLSLDDPLFSLNILSPCFEIHDINKFQNHE